MFSDTPLCLRARQIFTERSVKNDHSLLIDGDRIAEISDATRLNVATFDLGEWSIIPGLIDLHIHGREGCDVMDATNESLQTISNSLARHGVTGFLATTVTSSWTETIAALKNIASASETVLSGAQVLGAYSEGLFFSGRHKGAHNEQYFLPLEQKYFDEMIEVSGGHLKVLALAPELENANNIIQYLSSKDIRVMIGHSDANYDITTQALNAGACGGVHVFNGMRGIHHREPGCTGAVLTHAHALAEVIADGVHLHPAILKMIVKLKGSARTVLISDCIQAGGLSDGQYKLGKLTVNVKDGTPRTEAGSLAGSTLTLDRAIKNVAQATEIDLHEAVNMASIVPARFLNMADKIGSLAVGKKAHFALVDEDFNVHATFVNGRLVYSSQTFAQKFPLFNAKVSDVCRKAFPIAPLPSGATQRR